MRELLKRTVVTGTALYGLHRLNQRLAKKVPDIHLNADDWIYTWSEGNIVFQQAGEGEPILFLHGIGSGCSAFEWYKNISEFTKRYHCYTLDWLGFGRSDKPNIRYSPDLYVQLARDFIVDVIGEPVSIVANSFSAAYAIKLAAEEPELIRSLILICPAGLALQQEQENPLAQWTKNIVLHTPIVKTSSYYLITSRLHIRQFLLQSLYLHAENVTEHLVDMYYQAAHYGGMNAAYAPLAFLSGKLDIVIDAEWQKLNHPALIVWGEHAQIYPVSQATHFKRLKPSCHLHIFHDSALMPHDEEAYRFNKLCLQYLSGELATNVEH